MTTTTTRISLLQRFILWREAHISERIFVLILSFIIGILTALAAFALKQLIGTIQHLLMPAIRQANAWYLILPPIGVLLTAGVVKLFIRDDISHGVTKVLGAMSQRKSRIKPHNMWSSLLASSITIGFGGSVGAESPIVMTGAAIGSNTGRLFKLEQRQLMLLVGCGAAGAIAGIFKAPIAGLVFVVEVLLLDLTLSSVLPLLISSVTSATTAYLLTGQQAMFSFSKRPLYSGAHSLRYPARYRLRLHLALLLQGDVCTGELAQEAQKLPQALRHLDAHSECGYLPLSSALWRGLQHAQRLDGGTVQLRDGQ